MRIEVLGPVRLCTDEDTPVEVAERHLRILLASVVAAGGEPVSAEVLIDRLWHDDLPENPKKLLRSKLSRLRAILDEAQPGARDLLQHTPAGYRLDLPADVVDVDKFKTAIECARRTKKPQQTANELESVLELWRGEPFGDVGDELWLAPVKTELTDLRADAMEALAEAFLESGRPGDVVADLRDAIQDYPNREYLVAAMMTALYQVGRQTEALETYEALRDRLVEELGVDPNPQIRELHARILRQDPNLTTTASADRSAQPTPRQTNVPTEISPLIGRQREIGDIPELLQQSRLVTLTGVGGVGKTRLAIHIARRLHDQMERGAWFIDLTEINGTPPDQPVTSERISTLTLNTFELPERDVTRSEINQLVDVLSAGSALLVVDNCEHVLGEATAFISEILHRAPEVRIVTTSREPLGLADEQRYNVSTLDTAPPMSGDLSEAAEFFVQRARATDPTFESDRATVKSLNEMSRRLDGLPLALELAASRVHGITVDDLMARLSDRLNLLRRPGSGTPRRQQTLRGMIDWSWSLLGPKHQVVLRRLAAQPGSLSLAAAETICADRPNTTRSPTVMSAEVVDILIDLVDRSMVTTDSTPAGVRYAMLESIATYAGEKLDAAGEREPTVRRHLDYYLDLAREADQHLRGPTQRRWLTRLESERTQLSNAFEAAVRLNDGDSAVNLSVATFWYQWIFGCHGNLTEELDIATRLPGPRNDTYAAAATLSVSMGVETDQADAAARLADTLALFDDDVARARVQWFAGTSLMAVGSHEFGTTLVDEAAGVLADAGEDWHVAVALSQRNWFLGGVRSQLSAQLPDGRHPEEVLRDIGDGWGLTQAHGLDHRLADIAGDYPRAAQAARRALEVCLDFGLWTEASDWYSAMAVSSLRSGDTTRATAYLAKGLKLATDTAYAHGRYAADFPAAMIARAKGDAAGARQLLDRWFTNVGVEATQDPNAHCERGFLAVQQGDLNRASHAIHALNQLKAGSQETPMAANILALAAAIHVLKEAPAEAAELLGNAAAVRERTGVPASAPTRDDVDRIYARIYERMDEQAIAAATRRGRDRDFLTQLETVMTPVG